MKKGLLLIAILLITLVNMADAQQYQYGYRTTQTLTSDVAIEVSPAATLTFYTVAADTNITYTADVSQAVLGDRIVFQITADASNRIQVFSDNLSAANDTVTATKTVFYEFIYNGTSYYMLGKLQAD